MTSEASTIEGPGGQQLISKLNSLGVTLEERWNQLNASPTSERLTRKIP